MLSNYIFLFVVCFDIIRVQTVLSCGCLTIKKYCFKTVNLFFVFFKNFSIISKTAAHKIENVKVQKNKHIQSTLAYWSRSTLHIAQWNCSSKNTLLHGRSLNKTSPARGTIDCKTKSKQSSSSQKKDGNQKQIRQTNNFWIRVHDAFRFDQIVMMEEWSEVRRGNHKNKTEI